MASPRTWLRAWLPAVAYMALIWALSSISQPPSTGGVPFKDKGAHAIEYGGLAVLSARGMAATFVPGAGLRLAVYNITFGSFWGLTDEIHQAYVPGRSSEVADVGADVVGAVLGTAAYLLWRRRRRDTDTAEPPA